MNKIIILSLMLIFSLAKDAGATGGSPWDPRVGKSEGITEGTKDEQLSSGRTEETIQHNDDDTEE